MAKQRTRPQPAARRRAPAHPELPVERYVVGAAAVASGLLFWRSGIDDAGLPRGTFYAVLALGLLVYWVVRGARGGPWPADLGRAANVLLGLVVVLLVVAAVTGPSVGFGFVGRRVNGAVPYLSYALLLISARQLDPATWRAIVRIMSVVLAVVSIYGLLQWLGVDPFSWQNDNLTHVFGTFAQANFAAGWLAIAMPFAVGVAASEQLPPRERFVAVLTAALAVVFLRGTRSFQGLPALVVGLLPLAYVVGQNRVASIRRALGGKGRYIAAAAVILCAALLLAPPVRHSVRRSLDSGFHERRLLWAAAAKMIREDPLLGKGVGGFHEAFAHDRPAQHAREFGFLSADAPHDVPLEMGTNGGLPLLIAYLAFVGYVGLRLARGIRREPSLVLATIGGAWLAYQVQSLVSIDVPALAVMHWILAGGILGLTTASSDQRPRDRRRDPRREAHIALAAAAIIVVLAMPLLTRPLRADASEQLGLVASSHGDYPTAVKHLLHASRLAPWSDSKVADLANVYQKMDQPGLALQAGQKAVRISPGTIQYRVAVAQLAAELSQWDLAERSFQEAMRIDPYNEQLRRMYADYRKTRNS